MRHVWRQPLPYYAYEGLHQLIATVKGGTSRAQRRELDLIDGKEARLLFRVTNFFNPDRLLQVGAATGIESVAMLEVNRASRLYLYDPRLEMKPLAVRVLQSQLDRVECYDDMMVAASEFLDGASTDEPSAVALINVPVDEAVLERLLAAHVVLVMRNLSRDESMRRLFEMCSEYMSMGQTYTNGKIALLLPNPKLQREDFSLWL